jgi:hypothetical protein
MAQYEITAEDGTRGAVVGLDALEEVLSDFAERGVQAVALSGRDFIGLASDYPHEGFWFYDPDGEAFDANERDYCE